MGSRWFNLVIVVFWLTSMSWLMMAKVLPPLAVGEPPNYASMYAFTSVEEEPVYWSLLWNDERIGWASNEILRDPSGIELRSRVHFRRVPVDEMAPPWMRGLLKNQLEAMTTMSLDARSIVYFNPDGQLRSFRSSMQLADLPDIIRMYGDMRDRLLHVQVDSGGVSYSTERYMPAGSLLADELSPQTRLPNLRLGQTWSVESYNPFRPPNSPVDLLTAKVEETDIVAWGGRTRDVHVVVYRAESGLGFLSGRHARTRLWVSKEDGTVFRQQIDVLGSRLTFQRLDGEETKRLLRKIGDPADRHRFGIDPAKLSTPETPQPAA